MEDVQHNQSEYIRGLSDRKRLLKDKIRQLEELVRAMESLEGLETESGQAELLTVARMPIAAVKSNLSELTRTGAILRIFETGPYDWLNVKEIRDLLHRGGFKSTSKNQATLIGIALNRITKRGLLVKQMFQGRWHYKRKAL